MADKERIDRPPVLGRSHDRVETLRDDLTYAIRTPYMHSTGYLAVGLRDGESRRTILVHRIVATAFLRRPEESTEVCHRDGNPVNNNAANLYWGTRSDNQRDAVRHGTHHQSSKTHCKRGHEFTPENTGRQNGGYRYCLTCKRNGRSRGAA